MLHSPASLRPLARLRTPAGFARTAWIVVLLAAVCFEGVLRKFVDDVPGVVFYLAKDAWLVTGLLAFGVSGPVLRDARRLLGGVLPFLLLAFGWTIIQAFNPDAASVDFIILGLRSYWLWWMAPLVIATALTDSGAQRIAVVTISAYAIVISLYAALQFSLPASDPLNAYAIAGDPSAIATVGTTGRVRVTSTFSYISGFTDFVTIAPSLLLALGLGTSRRAIRLVAIVGATVCAIALPMAGSRAAVLAGGGGLILVAWGAGLLRTRIGRRSLVAGVAGVLAAMWLAPDAVQGVGDRFDSAETGERFEAALEYVPPFAMFLVEHPLLGVGTGTMQNAAHMAGVERRYETEYEPGRYLVELGVPGYLLMSVVRLGLALALFRAGRELKRSGQAGEAGGALALAGFALVGNLVFDHVWQAIFFIGVGLILNAHARTQSGGSALPA